MRHSLAATAAALALAGMSAGPGQAQAQINDPTDVSGLTLWLDATDITGTGADTPGGAEVATWVDKSGQGNDVTAEGGPDTTPEVLDNEVNGLDAVNFTSSGPGEFNSTTPTERLVADGSVATPGSDGMTIFFGGRSENNQPGNEFAGENTDAPHGRFFQVGDTDGDPDGTTASQSILATQTDSSFRYIGGAEAFEDSLMGSSDDSPPVTATFQINGNPSVNDGEMFLNTVEKSGSPDGGDALSIGDDQTMIGSGWGGGYSEGDNPQVFNRWDGDLGELVVYDRLLSDSERQDVQDYLQARWVPSPATLPMALMGLGALTLAGRRRRQAA